MRITRIESTLLRVPTNPPRASPAEERAGRASHIVTLLVQIETDAGLHGLGTVGVQECDACRGVHPAAEEDLEEEAAAVAVRWRARCVQPSVQRGGPGLRELEDPLVGESLLGDLGRRDQPQFLEARELGVDLAAGNGPEVGYRHLGHLGQVVTGRGDEREESQDGVRGGRQAVGLGHVPNRTSPSRNSQARSILGGGEEAVTLGPREARRRQP